MGAQFSHFFHFNFQCQFRANRRVDQLQYVNVYYLHEAMYLMYYLDDNGQRVYTLKKVDPNGKPTLSAHPARFSPEDKYSQYRIIVKRRYNLLPTQQPKPVY